MTRAGLKVYALYTILALADKVVEPSQIQLIEEVNNQIVPNILNVIKGHNAAAQLLKTSNSLEKYLKKANSINKNDVSAQQRNTILKQRNLEFVRELPHDDHIRKILVKRIVKKNHVPKLEYDHIEKTLYRPITQRASSKQHRIYRSLPPFELPEIFNFPPIKANPPNPKWWNRQSFNKGNQLALFAKYPLEPRIYLRVNKDADISKILSDMGKSIDGTSKDSLRDQGEKALNNELTTPAPDKFWYPKYTLWNYWTYKKPYAQDRCPNNQIKINGICIWMPPHRRFLENLGYQPYD